MPLRFKILERPTGICSQVLREAKVEPPIQTEHLRSGGALILTLALVGARAAISLLNLSATPTNTVVPPESTLFWGQPSRVPFRVLLCAVILLPSLFSPPFASLLSLATLLSDCLAPSTPWCSLPSVWRRRAARGSCRLRRTERPKEAETQTETKNPLPQQEFQRFVQGLFKD
eukprot:873064-Rhodomonas_salina.2